MARPPLPLETWGKVRRITTQTGKPAAVAYYRDLDGKRRRVLRTGATPAKAEAALIEALRARLAGAEDNLAPTSTIEQLSSLWLKDLERSAKSPSTISRYRSVVSSRVIPQLGAMRINEATVPRLQRAIDLVEQDSASQARILGLVLAGMLDMAVRQGAAKSNSARNLRLPSQQRREVRAPSVEEVAKLREALDRYDAKPPARGDSIRNLARVADMMLATGARIGEVLALQWSDFNLEAWTVTIQSTLVNVPGAGLERRSPKTRSSVRTLTLPEFVRPWLSSQLKDAHVPWVFPSATGQARWPENIRTQWREAVRGTSVEWIGPHDLRKAVATALGTEAAREQLGHKSISITDRHYVEKSTARPDRSAELETFARK